MFLSTFYTKRIYFLAIFNEFLQHKSQSHVSEMETFLNKLFNIHIRADIICLPPPTAQNFPIEISFTLINETNHQPPPACRRCDRVNNGFRLQRLPARCSRNTISTVLILHRHTDTHTGAYRSFAPTLGTTNYQLKI